MNKTLSLTATSNSEAVSQSVLLTGEGALDVDVVIPKNTADKKVEVAFAVAGLELIFILSGVGLLLETNSGSAAQDSITIAANVPFAWWADSGVPCPFEGDVTAMYFSNTVGGANGTDANVTIRGLCDVTP